MCEIGYSFFLWRWGTRYLVVPKEWTRNLICMSKMSKENLSTFRTRSANSKKPCLPKQPNKYDILHWKTYEGAYTTKTTSVKKRLVMTLVTIKLIRLPGPPILGVMNLMSNKGEIETILIGLTKFLFFFVFFGGTGSFLEWEEKQFPIDARFS